MIETIYNYIRPAAYTLVPKEMRSAEATLTLLAIGQHESGFSKRFQFGGGPARSYWQFELTGLRGVMRHQATRAIAKDVCGALGYRFEDYPLFDALPHNDVLACAFARLLLWTLPDPLPAIGDGAEAYRQYIEAWRPGKPRPKDWPDDYAKALSVMNI